VELSDDDAPSNVAWRGIGPGDRTAFTCPTCGGSLSRSPDGDAFECEIGHKFALADFPAAHGEAVRTALVTAVRLLEEDAAVRSVVADAKSERGAKDEAERLIEEASNVRRDADVLWEILANLPG
jgi:hypothetical protein